MYSKDNLETSNKPNMRFYLLQENKIIYFLEIRILNQNQRDR